MAQDWTSLSITRGAVALPGSPFSVKLRYRRLHVDPQIAPLAAKRPIQEFLIFQQINAPVLVGDMVTLPDETLAKIIDVRSYQSSLQCLLQRLPYQSLQTFLPAKPSAVLLSDHSLGDSVYSSGPVIFGLLEPHGVEQSGTVPGGQFDRRLCWLFSTAAVAPMTVVVVGPDYWLVVGGSNTWPVSNDYRATVRRLEAPPAGVS